MTAMKKWWQWTNEGYCYHFKTPCHTSSLPFSSQFKDLSFSSCDLNILFRGEHFQLQNRTQTTHLNIILHLKHTSYIHARTNVHTHTHKMSQTGKRERVKPETKWHYNCPVDHSRTCGGPEGDTWYKLLTTNWFPETPTRVLRRKTWPPGLTKNKSWCGELLSKRYDTVDPSCRQRRGRKSTQPFSQYANHCSESSKTPGDTQKQFQVLYFVTDKFQWSFKLVFLSTNSWTSFNVDLTSI